MKTLTKAFLSRLHEGELKLATSILRWKLQKEGRPLPGDAELNAAAASLLEEARGIAKKTGRNLYEILKEEASDLFRPKSS